MDAKETLTQQANVETQAHTSKHQQRQETRDVITPYAFEVSPELFGTPLATPTRRALALSVDLILVAILSGITGNALAILVAILLWVTSRRLKRENRLPSAILLVRILATLLIAAGILGLFRNDTAIWSNSQSSNEHEVNAAEAVDVVVFTGTYAALTSLIQKQVAQGDCPDAETCWSNIGDEFVEDLVELAIPKSAKSEMLDEFFEKSRTELSDVQYQSLETKLLAQFETLQAEADKVAKEEQAIVDVKPKTKSIQDYSIVKWFKGIASDLGIGFGWAAVYFTGLMVLLKGQTIGKKLFGIKVIKLDGSSLNVWESFGRYGGYGAGLATGLLGFLQVYWDPNRQAIQDKISETLVIRLKAKQ
ncbi:RDD family protein [Aliiglaciecola sp. 2_MG-2023]|uniref:RDD family protein n=1 Tax=unclassified Aliiglaciecola TaxID=2593648 RepID=UPI0026E26993|nr:MULTISPECIES: RDD family protein [unclassified Aliiglaciecola]MDO6710457.1 RDD family protein [Aliiglaciecola sp. 2_MG-2023]MDO6751678.1 RDD family protein [Aliiglaciecola sp. 1_MG-2023]